MRRFARVMIAVLLVGLAPLLFAQSPFAQTPGTTGTSPPNTGPASTTPASGPTTTQTTVLQSSNTTTTSLAGAVTGQNNSSTGGQRSVSGQDVAAISASSSLAHSGPIDSTVRNLGLMLLACGMLGLTMNAKARAARSLG